MTHPFRFGVQSDRAASPDDWRRPAQLAESLGYAVPAMAVAAEATATIRIGCRVLCDIVEADGTAEPAAGLQRRRAMFAPVVERLAGT